MSAINSENRVVKILVKRDHITEEEAIQTVNDCLDEIHNSLDQGAWWDAEEIFADYTGLEPDYLMDVL